MGLKVTIAHIAKALNTTPATVSRALNDHSSISEKTKQRIRETASRLNYKRNKIASSLRLGQSGIIGVIIPSAEINFFGSVVHGIESIANKNGFNVLIYQSNESSESEVKGIETFLSARVDGILVSIAKNTTEFSHFIAAKGSGIPIIFFDRSNDELGILSVVIDDYRGAFLATEHLIQQGYKKIAHISGPEHLKIFNDRLRGYRDALEAYKLKPNDQFLYKGNVSIEAGREAVEQFLTLDNPPDAIFAVEDFTALGALKALKEKNINIPDDFGVIGFANESFGEHITPTLSTIDQQTVQMGKESFKLLMQLMNKERYPLNNKKVVLEPVPIFRNSSLRRTI
jgi:LacI family transcriptional regulator